MSTVSGPGTGSKEHGDNKNKETSEEEGEEEEEYEDGHGSRVVATLCRKVNVVKPLAAKPPQNGTDNDLVIAVVVTSSGTRHDAKICADAHIENLKTKIPGDGKIIKCEMIAQINQKSAARAKKEAENKNGDGDGDDGESDNGDESEEADNSEDAEETDKTADAEPKTPYTSRVFMESFYPKNASTHPLYSCGATKSEAIKYLKENADALRKLGKATTWIIPHESVTGTDVSATNNYYKKGTKGDKTVVVVLSAFFLLQKNPQEEDQPTKKQAPNSNSTSEKQTHKKIGSHILVCNIPEPPTKVTQANYQETYATHYLSVFKQVAAFIKHYNDNIASEEKMIPKIERIALSYPPQLYDMAPKGKKKVQPPKKDTGKKVQNHGSSSKKVVKAASAEKTKKASASISSSPASSDSSGSDTDSESDDSNDTYSNEDEDEKRITNDVWGKAVIGELEPLVEQNMLLMCDENTPWQAPGYVKDYFENSGTVTRKFPDCIDPDSKEDEDEDEDDDDDDEGHKIKLNDVPSTLFVCDRKAGKMVGNDNDSSTTGGSFGSWVPMHYTAVKASTETYSNAEEINDLINVIKVQVKKK